MNLLAKFKLKHLQKKVNKVHDIYEQQNSNVHLKSLLNAHARLAHFYDQHQFDKDLPNAVIHSLECHRAMAHLGEVKSQYTCGQRLLERAKFWDNLAVHPIYGSSIHKKYAKDSYEEALAYLQLADKQDYVLARRLLGLMSINGWGVPLDLQQGYMRILESIDLEQAWGQATRIFEELNLNSPEFFSALRSYKSKE